MITVESYKSAIDHITRFGDTDIFPHLIEISFLQQNKEDIATYLSMNKLSDFKAAHSIEALAPKSRYGFRIANQLLFLDTLIFTAAVIEIADDLENIKMPIGNFGPFAYRFEKTTNGSLFSENKTYRDWLERQKTICEELEFSHVIFTDIADFYQRIYFHRIENVLRTATENKFAVSVVERIIKAIRAKQSYGIPVGGSASRLIAECVISDFDHGLTAEDFAFTRFVDDIRIFVPTGQDPYRPLCFTAEILLSEGLTLNAQKTKVLSKSDYLNYLNSELDDVFDNSQTEALGILASKLYFDEIEEFDENEIAALQTLNLKGLLVTEIEKDHWDFGKIKAVIRAMRLTQSGECIDIIVEKFSILLPFIKDLLFLFDSLKSSGKLTNFNITELILSNLAAGAGHSVPAIRAWLLEFFVRKITPITIGKFNSISRMTEMDGRQIIIANGIFGNVVYFRKNKTRFENLSKFEQYAFIISSSCLPKDEYETWIRAIKVNMHGILDSKYCDWAVANHGKLSEILEEKSSIT